LSQVVCAWQQVFIEKLLKLTLQFWNIAPALLDDIGGRAVAQQRVQQMFERHVFVPPPDRLFHGGRERLLQFSRDHKTQRTVFSFQFSAGLRSSLSNRCLLPPLRPCRATDTRARAPVPTPSPLSSPPLRKCRCL